MELKTGDFFCEHAYRDEQDHLWLYLREEELTDRYPNGGYRILGDLTKKADAKDLVLVGAQGQRHPLSPYSGKLKKNEKIKGYIPLDEEDAYVRIVEKKKGRLLSYLIAAVLLITIFLGGIWLGQVNRAVDEPVRIASGELSNPNPENIRLPGITEVHAQAGNTRVKQLLLNVEGNAYNLTYTITLDEAVKARKVLVEISGRAAGGEFYLASPALSEIEAFATAENVAAADNHDIAFEFHRFRASDRALHFMQKVNSVKVARKGRVLVV